MTNSRTEPRAISLGRYTAGSRHMVGLFASGRLSVAIQQFARLDSHQAHYRPPCRRTHRMAQRQIV